VLVAKPELGVEGEPEDYAQHAHPLQEAERAGVLAEDVLKVERAHQNAAHHQHAEAVRRIEDLLVHHQKFRSKLDVVWYQNINRLSVVLKMKHQHASFFLPLNTSKKFRK
jgi:hypothetical protein